MPKRPVEIGPDSFGHWMERYLELAMTGLRPEASVKKIILHLERFQQFFIETYGHDRLSACLRRDVQMWQTRLEQHYAPATVNNHLASLSGFTHWLQTHNPTLFPAGNPTQGVGEMPLPPLEPRALSDQQVQSLKNVCDRLEVFHRRRKGALNDIHTHARPLRDRAIVFFLLSTGLRREELVRLDLAQIEPNTVTDLRRVRKVQVNRV